jgi:hypothetical protein
MGRRENSASVAHMLAGIALRMIGENPDILERYKAACREANVPFDPDQITPMALSLAEMGITESALLLLQSAREDKRRLDREPTVLNIPLPLGDDDGTSAMALAIGSFAVEHIRSSPERLAALDEWMRAEHPDCGWNPGDFTDDRMEQADKTLTIMAHVTNTAMDSGVLEDVQRHAREHRHEPDGNPARYEPGSYRDDGTRHV